MKTCRTSLHSAEQSLKFKIYPEKYSLSYGKAHTLFGLHYSFGETAGFLRSEPLAPPVARAGALSQNERKREVKQDGKMFLNS